ncbi:Endogenous retrovirus group FC1 Env polyprotein [Plecturocebus cupreus]
MVSQRASVCGAHPYPGRREFYSPTRSGPLGGEEATFFMDCVFSVTSCMATASGATPPTAGVPITPVKFTGHNPALVNNQLRTLLQNRALIPNIRDPRNECWNAGVTAKLNTPPGNMAEFWSYTRIVPEGIGQLSSVSHTVLENEATLTDATGGQHAKSNRNHQPHPLFSTCFPQHPLWPQAPSGPGSTCHHHLGAHTTLTDKPLLKVHSQDFSLCYETARSFSLKCNTVTVTFSLCAPPGGTSGVTGHQPKLLMLPSLSLCACRPGPAVGGIQTGGLHVFPSAFLRTPKQAVPLPMVVGPSCTLSATQLEDKLRVAIKRRPPPGFSPVTEHAAGPAEKRSTCPLLQEQCGYCINETGLVEENVDAPYRLQDDLRTKPKASASALSWWQSPKLTWLSPKLTWLSPIITPIIALCLLCCFTPTSDSQLRHQPTDPPTSPDSAGSSQKDAAPYIIKRSECKAGCLAGRLDTPTSALDTPTSALDTPTSALRAQICTPHQTLHSAPSLPLENPAKI